MAVSPIEAYIRQSALQRGIDPNIAVRVAMSEGGVTNPVRQSDYVKNGRRERSYGPFQLYIDGGLGNRALAAGIDPRNPNQWQAGVDFALDEAKRKGWGQWYGAAKAGVGDWDGIKGGSAVNGQPGRVGGDGMVARNYDPQVAAATNTPVFGSMSPGIDNTLTASTGGGAGMTGDEAAAIGGILGNDEGGLAGFGKGLAIMGKGLDAAMPEMPRGGGMPMPRADPQAGNMLLSVLNQPTVDQMFLKRRLGFLG